MSCTTSTLKSCVIVKIIFHIISIVEMIAYNITIFFDNEVAPIGIIVAFLLFCRRHAKCSIYQKNLHLVLIKCHDIPCEAKRILCSNDFHYIFYIRSGVGHTVTNETRCYEIGHTRIKEKQIVLECLMLNVRIFKMQSLINQRFHTWQMVFYTIDFCYHFIRNVTTFNTICDIGCNMRPKLLLQI